MRTLDEQESGSALDLDTQETRSIKRSLRRIRKASKVFRIIALIVFLMIMLFWIGSIGMIIMSLLLPQILASDIHIEPILLLPVSLFGGILLLIVGTVYRIFFDMEKRNAPYTIKQVKRIRLIAYLIFADAVFEAIFTPMLASIAEVSRIQLGLIVAGGYDGSTIPINIGLLLAGAGILCFSIVVEYGVLLQRLTDETV